MDAAIENEVPQFTSTAVCYRCQYRGQEAAGNRCPTCSFPLIIETRLVPGGPRRVRDILDRSTVSVSGPPLPGVDGRPRKAQLLAEARRRRISELRVATPVPPTEAAPARFPTGTGSGTAVAPRRPVWAIGLALLGAVAAGVLAA
ncbi:MAG TPA: hypothetical protein VL172_02035, partial [Kofleriaceae bacterium]|nr:hypothetical protein [Kofleriaceae bacterium]